MKKGFKKTKGITLIALVITIIVLLILAGVSIASLAGEGGILNKANKAKNENDLGKIEEEIKLAYNAVQMGSIMNGWDINKKAEELQKELRKQDEEAEVVAIRTELEITYKGYDVIIYENGKIEVEDMTKQKPTLTVTTLPTEENPDSILIKVVASTTEGEIENIESIDGLNITENTSNSEKTFEVEKNGTYYFRAIGTNGRTAKASTEVTGIIAKSESLLKAISEITEGGEQTVTVKGMDKDGNKSTITYSLNVIDYKKEELQDGKLVLN